NAVVPTHVIEHCLAHTVLLLSMTHIAKKVKVSVSTVSFTIKRHSESGVHSHRKTSDRPKEITESKDKRLTGQQLQVQLNSGHRKQVLVSTVKRRLQATGLTGQIAARKPLLRRQNKTKRLASVMKRCHRTTEDWKKVLWTDESKLEIFGSSLRIFICCRVGEKMAACLQSVIASLPIWGCH
uniref:Transposase Tc1-like domain-containing protein n=1 Tax=Haplochromis burtoni TaxID=8153 RepID=A0A3Q2W5F0_HAPBU